MLYIQQFSETVHIMNDGYNDFLIMIENGQYSVYDEQGERIDKKEFADLLTLQNYYENLTAEQYDNENNFSVN